MLPKRAVAMLITALALCLVSPAYYAQNESANVTDESDSRLAVYDALTGILHIPSLQYDGGHIWVDLLYDGEDEATLIASGPTSSDASLVSLDLETGDLSVPFVAMDGVADTGRYGLALTIETFSPEVVMQLRFAQRHQLFLTEVSGSDMELVAANDQGEYLGVATDSDSDSLTRIVYVRENAEGLSLLTLLLDEQGVPEGIVYHDQVLELSRYEGPAIDSGADDTDMLTDAANMFSALACDQQTGASAELEAALDEACTSFLLSTLSYFQDRGLFESQGSVVTSVIACDTNSTDGSCDPSFRDGLATVVELIAQASDTWDEATRSTDRPAPPLPDVPPTLTSVEVLGPLELGDTLSLSFNDLLSASDATDPGGSVQGFMVTSVTSGSLRIDGALYYAANNNTIDASRAFAWTPPANTLGELDAFTVVALDNQGNQSASAVTVSVEVKSPFSGGLGTAADPWQIATAADLDMVRDYHDDEFILTEDIDLGGDNPDGPFYNVGEGWEPIGTDGQPFVGQINGDGYIIRGLFINRASDQVGLFGVIGPFAELRNMALVNVDVTGLNRTGALVGSNKAEIISIERSFATGVVSGRDIVGGLVGENAGDTSGAIIDSSFAAVTVNGNSVVGGLVGNNDDQIWNSYATGAVNGNSVITGGLVGTNNGEIEGSYAVGAVNGALSPVGGLVAFNTDSVTGSYWDTQTSGQSGSSGGTGLATADMQDLTNYSGWGSAWAIDPAINSGYPYLQWQTITPPTLSSVDVMGPASQGNTFTVSFDDLLAASDAEGNDSTISAFIVESVTSGSLNINGGAFDATSNNHIDASRSAVWTPSAGTTGDVNALTVVALDDRGNQSTAAVAIEISVAAFAGGEGTQTNPWEVSSGADLDRMRENPDGHYVLTSDIDLGGDDTGGQFYNGGAGWQPVGSDAVPFTGSLDGAGHTISGLFVNRSSTDNVGLFGVLSASAEVSNIVLMNADVTGDSHVGVLAGFNRGAISNIYVVGEVSAQAFVGGLVGIHEGSITDSYAVAAVSGGTDTGGLVGSDDDGGTTGTTTDSFWHIDVSNQVVSAGGQGLDSDEMRDQSSFPAWNFGLVWGINPAINSGYPYLRAQTFVPPTLSHIADRALVTTGSTLTLSFTDLVAASDAAAGAGEIVALQVVSITNGSLVINGAAYDAETNNRIDASRDAVWTLPADADGDLQAFTVVALDDRGNQSAPAVPVTVDLPFSGGEGTAANPWKIASAADLDRVREYRDGHFVQTGDIYLGDDDPNRPFYNGGSGWQPIGGNADPFSGTLDGAGYDISGLFIDRSRDFVGLFGAVSASAELANISLVDINVSGRSFTGGLVGENNAGTISGSSATGTVYGGSYVGGLVGYNFEGTISRSNANVAVDGTGSSGGLVGETYQGVISQSYATGAVVGTTAVGGLAGSSETPINDSYASGAVDGDSFVGGLIGLMSSSLTNSYAIGAVSGDSQVGGLASGGFPADDSYWNTETSGQTSGGVGTGLTTDEMQDQSSYDNWDFASIWAVDPTINNGYPYLRENSPQ